ncbi:MAG TPA: hypothetical protein VGG27_18370 [Magnetospirillaceae bacterium]|jgi:hypothetical protein
MTNRRTKLRRIIAVSIAAGAITMAAASGTAFAQQHDWHGGGHAGAWHGGAHPGAWDHGWHGRGGGGVGIGLGFGVGVAPGYYGYAPGPYAYSDPYAYSYAYPVAPPPAAVAGPSYFCPTSNAYYPAVTGCSVPWVTTP